MELSVNKTVARVTDFLGLLLEMRSTDRRRVMQDMALRELTAFEWELLEAVYDAQVRQPLARRSGDGAAFIAQADLVEKFQDRQKSSLAQALARLKGDGFLTSRDQPGRRGTWLKLSASAEELLFRLHEVDRLLIPKVISVMPDEVGGDVTITKVVQALGAAMAQATRLDSEKPSDLAQTTRESSIARCYHFLTGGTGMSFVSDRAKGDAVKATSPGVAEGVVAHKSFVRRAVAYLAAKGYRHFVDLGAGLVCNGATSEVLERVVPPGEHFKVLYVDSDAKLVATNGAILDPSDDRTRYVQGDAKDANAIINQARDFGIDVSKERVAIIAAAVFHFEESLEAVLQSLAELKASVAEGSSFAISHVVRGVHPKQTYATYNAMVAEVFPRTAEEIGRLFEGLEMESASSSAEVKRLVTAPEWRPDIVDPFLFGRDFSHVTSGTLVGVGVKRRGTSLS